jgi:hypothetical protein
MLLRWPDEQGPPINHYQPDVSQVMTRHKKKSTLFNYLGNRKTYEERLLDIKHVPFFLKICFKHSCSDKY